MVTFVASVDIIPMKIKYITLLIAGLFTQLAGLFTQQVAAQPKQKAKKDILKSENSFQTTGIWRGVFNIKPGVEVPFNFEIKNRNGNLSYLSFLNADEHFDGGFVKQKGDSLLINLD
ncbi:MAG: hypothetical protein EOO90_32365, partial [Pedobacter sp.]